MQQHRTLGLTFHWPIPDKTAKWYKGRLGLIGGWTALFGSDALSIHGMAHLAHLEEFVSTGCQLCEHRPNGDEGDEGTDVWGIPLSVCQSYLPCYLVSPQFASAVPRLRVLELELALGPILFNACMQSLGELEHLEELTFTPHPGGPTWAMTPNECNRVFAPEGIEFWQPWAIIDFNSRNTQIALDAEDIVPFSQPRFHASLKTLDLSWTRGGLSTSFAAFGHIWYNLAEQLPNFRALEVLDLSGCMWPKLAEKEMEAAMLSLPPTIKELYLEFNAGPNDGADWAANGVFAAFAAMPNLVELNMLGAHLGMAPALELATCCVPSTELHVVCELFELPADDAVARKKERERLAAAHKRLRRQLG